MKKNPVKPPAVKKPLLLLKKPVAWRINGIKVGKFRIFGPNKAGP